MNRIAVSTEEFSPPGWIGNMENFALKVLDEVKCRNWDLSILLCGDSTIKNLNAQYRNKAEPTDVLSFELGEETGGNGDKRYLPGDIVISLDTLRENSKYFKIPEDEELRRLVIHGILHLKGMDHKTNEDSEPMIELQEDILKKFKEEHILPGGPVK